MTRDGGSIAGATELTLVKQGQLARGHETYAGTRLGVFHITGQNAVAPFRFLRCAPRRFLPLAPFGICALREIQIPECCGDKFGWMVVDADDPAAFGFQLPGCMVEFFKCLWQRAFIVE